MESVGDEICEISSLLLRNFRHICGKEFPAGGERSVIGRFVVVVVAAGNVIGIVSGIGVSGIVIARAVQNGVG